MNDKLTKAFESLGIKSEKSEEVFFKSAVIGGHIITILDDSKIIKAATFNDINGIISNFVIEKKGNEVKEKLQAAKVTDETQAAIALSQAQHCLHKCPIKPTDMTGISDYELGSAKSKFGQVPAMFSWEDVYNYDQQLRKQAQPTIDQVEQSNEEFKGKVQVQPEVNHMRVYNQNIRLYVQCRVESILLDIIINNIDEKKTYQLTATQANNLSF